jgi:hypothetical protein
MKKGEEPEQKGVEKRQKTEDIVAIKDGEKKGRTVWSTTEIL